MDLWLAHPVTKAYLICLKTNIEAVNAKIAGGSYIDYQNNDLSMNQISSAIGWKNAVDAMRNLENILKNAEMIEVKDNDKNI